MQLIDNAIKIDDTFYASFSDQRELVFSYRNIYYVFYTFLHNFKTKLIFSKR